MRWALLGLAIGLATLAAPASASASSTIGETGVPGYTCAANDNLVQTVTGGPPSYTVPAGGGVITSWSFQAGAPGNSGKMLVMRPTGGADEFTVVGKTDLQVFTPGPAQTFETRIPVQGGETLGMRMPTSGVCLDFVSSSGDAVRYNTTAQDPPDGSTQTLNVPLADYRVLVAASVEADCDGDGLGDETQDPSVLGGSCPLRGRTLTLDANKNKVKKGKKVTLSGQLNEIVRQGECKAAQTVQLQRKRPSQSAFTTVKQLTTDAAGNFSTKRKVKKTFQYRALVPETDACLGQASNTEKVKVRKPK
jgi:hypothetical protein